MCAQPAASLKPWLTIGIPTFPRKEHRDYLNTTLTSLLEELPLDEADPFFGRVQVSNEHMHAVADKPKGRWINHYMTCIALFR